MDEQRIVEEMVELLEANEEIRVTDGSEDVFIQSVDDKEGYSFVSSTHEEFLSSREAIGWVVDYFGGVENIEMWE